MKNYNYMMVIALCLAISSCVPARKYQEMQSAKEQCEKDMDALKKKNEGLASKNKELESQVEVNNKTLEELNADTALLGKQYRQLKTQYDKINELNDILSNKSNALLSQASTENQKLIAELDATRVQLQNKEDALKFLEKNLNEKEANLNELNSNLEDRERRVNELESLIAQQEAASNALKKKVSDALLGFKDKGLTVEQKNGKVYVKMEAKLLFPSGSTKIDEGGKKALSDLANAVQNEVDMEIIVEGHTDTDKLNSSSIPRDNWELSVLRATEVIKYMMANSNLKPEILSASGRSEYYPVDPKDKAKNRRIEIILQPKLDELYQLIESE